MKKYKIIIAYDGTDYYGSQIQPGHITIIGTLQRSFEDIFGKEITIAGASRTDAGVHAIGQTAAFATDLAIEPEQLKHAWQNKLPESILIRSIQEAPLDWNPRHHVAQKTYYYHFFQERPLPFFARYGWYYRYPVNLEKLKEAFAMFVGTHDFRSFVTGEYESTIRTIISIEVDYMPRFKAYRIIITGPGFLRYMIRRMVGACLEVASRDTLSINDLKIILDKKNPEHLLPTAPAKGLLLYKIIYK